jgi:hypothetical protein
MVALWLLMGCCDSEQQDKAAKDKEGSTATGTIAAGETSQTTSTSIAFESDRDGNLHHYSRGIEEINASDGR